MSDALDSMYPASSNVIVTEIAETSVSAQVASDLANLLKSTPDPKKLLRSISNKIGVHEKTLTRILNQENKPSYMTVFKIYRYILGEFDDLKVVERAPESIKKYLLNANPLSLESKQHYFSSIDKEIKKNPVFAEVYVLASTGPTKKTDIIQRFGKYGLEILELMIQKNILQEIRTGEYILGSNQTNLSPETVLALGIQFSENYAKPENGYELGLHFMGFFAEGLSDEAYKQWQLIDQEAYFKKVNLAKDPASLGRKRAFTFMITETLENREDK